MGTLLSDHAECGSVKRQRIILAGSSPDRAYTIRASAEFVPFHTTHSFAAADKPGRSARRSPFVSIKPF
jgi:hypothetical protein